MKDSKDRKTFRARAQKQLEGIDPDKLQQVLDEYVRIPRAILPNEMLQIKVETRISVRENVARAKAAMVAKVNAENEAEDRAALAFESRATLASLPKLRTNAIYNSDSPISQPQMSFTGSAASLESDADSQHVVLDKQGTSSKRSSISSEQTLYGNTVQAGLPTPTSAGPSTEGGKERTTAVSREYAVPSSYRTLTPPRSRAGTGISGEGVDVPSFRGADGVVGSKHPSKDNPFASFITERSDAVAEALPNDLMLCYFAHNQVQDQLRSNWRRDRSASAEQVAKEFWEQLPQKEFEVSKEFEGQLGQMRALTMDQLIHMWVLRFWQRCKDEGW